MKINLSSQMSEDGSASGIAALSPEKRRLLELRIKGQVFDGHTLIARTLKDLGITHVYGISGTPVDETLAACAVNDILLFERVGGFGGCSFTHMKLQAVDGRGLFMWIYRRIFLLRRARLKIM